MQQEVVTLGHIDPIPGWLVNTRHRVEGWVAYEVTAEVGRPLFENGPTVCYTFSTRSMYYGAIHRANKNRAFRPPVIIPVPTEVTMRQFRQALYGANLLTAVDDAIELLPEPNRSIATIQWQYAQDVERFNAFVDAIQAILALTDDEVDAVFVTAATL